MIFMTRERGGVPLKNKTLENKKWKSPIGDKIFLLVILKFGLVFLGLVIGDLGYRIGGENKQSSIQNDHLIFF